MKEPAQETGAPAIRLMRTGDLAAVLAIQHQCYTGSLHEPLASFEARLRAAPSCCWVASVDGTLCAYLLCLPLRGDRLPALHAVAIEACADADWLYVHDLAIGPAARGRGLAQGMVDLALSWARAEGLHSAGLIAVQDAAPFWARLGFRACPEDPRVPRAKLGGFGSQAVFMSLPLSGHSAPGDPPRT